MEKIIGAAFALGLCVFFVYAYDSTHPRNAVTANAAASAQPVMISDRPRLIASDSLACDSTTRFDTLSRMVRQGDEAAADRLVGSWRAAGECRVLRTGETVFVLDLERAGSAVKIRPKGEPGALWVMQSAIGNEAGPAR